MEVRPNEAVAIPPAPNALRLLLEGFAARAGTNIDPVVQSDSYEFLLNYGQDDQVISFYFPIGLPPDAESGNRISRPVDIRDIPPLYLYVGQLRNRVLPVAAARFADQLTTTFVDTYECD